MKAMAGCKEDRRDRDIKLKGFSSVKQFAKELNTFYLRFDDNDFKSEIDILKQDLACSQFLNIIMIQVKGLFQRVNTKKSPGPDNIGGRVLRTCAGQLCEIFQYISPSLLCYKEFLKFGKNLL